MEWNGQEASGPAQGLKHLMVMKKKVINFFFFTTHRKNKHFYLQWLKEGPRAIWPQNMSPALAVIISPHHTHAHDESTFRGGTVQQGHLHVCQQLTINIRFLLAEPLIKQRNSLENKHNGSTTMDVLM